MEDVSIDICKVCQSLMNDPRILPCSHSFCLKCLETSTVSKESSMCPICRIGFQAPEGCLKNIRKNEFLEKLIELKRSSEKICKTIESDVTHDTTAQAKLEVNLHLKILSTKKNFDISHGTNKLFYLKKSELNVDDGVLKDNTVIEFLKNIPRGEYHIQAPLILQEIGRSMHKVLGYNNAVLIPKKTASHSSESLVEPSRATKVVSKLVKEEKQRHTDVQEVGGNGDLSNKAKTFRLKKNKKVISVSKLAKEQKSQPAEECNAKVAIHYDDVKDPNLRKIGPNGHDVQLRNTSENYDVYFSNAQIISMFTIFVAICTLLLKRRNITKANTKGALLIMVALLVQFNSMAVAEKPMDRYVVREGSSFEMDCKYDLENIKVVKWEFASNHNNTKEIIYDSQSTNFLKPGFEVSCEHQQTFISTCIIKLIKTKTDNSGKYICYVGEAEGKEAMLDAVVEIELVIRGPKHQTMVVNNGDSVILPCEHNITNLTRARWSHVSLQGVMTYQLYYMDWTEATNNNYEGLCKSHQPYCNLKILQANKESAGRYICMVGESQEFEKKYGMDQLTYFVEIQLVVGELQCNENMNKDLTLIGENDCYGIEADVLNLKCSFNYFGNTNYNLLHLRWIEKFKFNSLEKKINSSLINHEVKDETNKISIQTNLSVAYEQQMLQCALENSLVKPCHLHEFKVQYIKNNTKRLPPMHSNDLHNIKCSANKSSNVQCSYYWVHEIGGALVENPYAILPVENMNSPGNYTCIGKCHLGRNDCIVKAMEFEILQERTEILTVILYVACGLLAFVVVVLIALFLRFCKPRTVPKSPLLVASLMVQPVFHHPSEPSEEQDNEN